MPLHKYQPRTGHTREPDPKHLEQNSTNKHEPHTNRNSNPNSHPPPGARPTRHRDPRQTGTKLSVRACSLRDLGVLRVAGLMTTAHRCLFFYNLCKVLLGALVERQFVAFVRLWIVRVMSVSIRSQPLPCFSFLPPAACLLLLDATLLRVCVRSPWDRVCVCSRV